jgi:hypothetical protein
LPGCFPPTGHVALACLNLIDADLVEGERSMVSSAAREWLAARDASMLGGMLADA